MPALALSLLVSIAAAHPHPACPEESALAPVEEPEELAITVLLAGDLRYTGIEVACPGGFTATAEFEYRAARVAPAPPERCRVMLVGAPPKVVEAGPGGTLLCAPNPPSAPTAGDPGLLGADPVGSGGRNARAGVRCVDPVDALRRPSDHPPPASGTVAFALDPGLPFTAVEVSCPSGFRERARFEDGRASVDALPVEHCRAKLKGGPPMTLAVAGGLSFRCRATATDTVCAAR